MNNRGQIAAWEAILIIILMGSTGYMFYLYAHKPSQAQIFNKDSKANIQQPNYAPHFGCVNVKIEEYRKGNNAEFNRDRLAN